MKRAHRLVRPPDYAYPFTHFLHETHNIKAFWYYLCLPHLRVCALELVCLNSDENIDQFYRSVSFLVSLRLFNDIYQLHSVR
jgi:hypothetical protein